MNQNPRTIQQQIAILKSRGMAFSDENLATSYLTRISYFRLKYYWTDMIDVATGHFSDGASFDTVIQRYEFDKRKSEEYTYSPIPIRLKQRLTTLDLRHFVWNIGECLGPRMKMTTIST